MLAMTFPAVADRTRTEKKRGKGNEDLRTAEHAEYLERHAKLVISDVKFEMEVFNSTLSSSKYKHDKTTTKSCHKGNKTSVYLYFSFHDPGG